MSHMPNGLPLSSGSVIPLRDEKITVSSRNRMRAQKRTTHGAEIFMTIDDASNYNSR